MDPSSHFRIASITQIFTATVVLQLAAEGRIGLDQAVNAITPGLLADDRVTVRMLLNHTRDWATSRPAWAATAS